MTAREAFNKRTKAELKELKEQQQIKEWWQTNNLLQGGPAKTCSIPALKDTSNNWVLDATEKATLLAKTQMNKCVLTAEAKNEYSEIKYTAVQQDYIQLPTEEMANQELIPCTIRLLRDLGYTLG